MNDSTSQITVADAAAILDVSERTVWRYLRSGRLQGETVGPAGAQRTMIDAAAVEAIKATRGGGAEVVALRAEVDRLGDELATLRAERDQMRTALGAARAEMGRMALKRGSRAGDLVLAGLSTLSRRGTRAA